MKGGPRVYLVIRGRPRSHHIVIGGLVVVVERLRGLGAGRGIDRAESRGVVRRWCGVGG